MILNKSPLVDFNSFVFTCVTESIYGFSAIINFYSQVNLMPFEMSVKLRLHILPSIASLQLVDKTTIFPIRLVEDILVHVGNFSIPTDFVVLDIEINEFVLLGKPFLDTFKAIIGVSNGNLKLSLDKDELNVNLVNSLKYPIIPDDEFDAWIILIT